MADRDWRILDRRLQAGDVSVLPALNAARRRCGLEPIRFQIVHYLKRDEHHRLDGHNRIDVRVDRSPIWSACGGVELWPRGYTGFKRKVHFTPSREAVTCKKCLRSLGSPNFREGPPKLHLLLKHDDGREHHLCGGRYGGSTEVVEEVGCRGCMTRLTGRAQNRGHELNARGRRRLRRARTFAFKHPPPGPQSDFRHGVY